MSPSKVFCSTAFIALLTALSATAQTPTQSEPKWEKIGAFGIGWTYLYADVGAGERESLEQRGLVGRQVIQHLFLLHAFAWRR